MNKILNFECFFDLLLLLFIFLYKILLSHHYSKRHQKGKWKHAQTHSFRTWSDTISFSFSFSFFSFLLYGPIRSRLVEHNKKVELGKSIRSKLFSLVRTFSQSPLSSVGFEKFIVFSKKKSFRLIMLCCYDWLEFCYVILLWWIFWLLMCLKNECNLRFIICLVAEKIGRKILGLYFGWSCLMLFDAWRSCVREFVILLI